MPQYSNSMQNVSPAHESSPGGPYFNLESHDKVVANMPGAAEAKKAMEMIMDSKTAWSKQHDAINEAFEFYGGEQWGEEDKLYLKEENRIPVVFNYVANHIDVIVGSEIHNRQDTRFVPRNTDPQTLPQISALGELETSAYDWVMQLCSGEEETSEAFADMMKCGMGWTETYIDKEIEKDVRICVRRINPMEMLWDARATMRNLEDARWVARIKQVPLEQAIAMFPDKEDELRAIEHYQAGLTLDQTPEKIEELTPIMYEPGRITTSPGAIAGKKGLVVIVQYQHVCLEDYYVVKDNEGKESEHTQDQFDTLQERADDISLDLDYAKKTRKVYKQQFIAGNQLPLTEDEDIDVQAGGFTFGCMTGKWDQKEKVYRGHLFQLMDPQRYANKYLSQTIHIINSNPKGGVLAEADVFKDPTAVERDWARPNSIILVEKDALAQKRVEVKPVTHLPDATFQMWQHCIQSITGVSGVNPEILGQSQGDQPALTMRQRMVQGMQVNAIYFQALTRFRRSQARRVMEFIREFIADGRMIRIGGPFNAQQLPLFREEISPEYDIVIDEAIRSPNAKAEVWAGLQPIIPVIIRSGLLVPELVDLVPGMPAALAAKIKEKMPQGGAIPQAGGRGKGGQAGQQQSKVSPEETAAKVAKLQEEVNLLKAKQQEVAARARALDAQSQMKGFAVAADAKAKGQKSQLDAQKAQHDMTLKARSAQLGDFSQMVKNTLGGNRQPRVREGDVGYEPDHQP